MAQSRRASKSHRARASAAPAIVGAERRRLERQNQVEVRRRVKEYKAAVTALQAKGRARGPRALGVGGPAPLPPLSILAEGDSWFDYPPFQVLGLGGGGIIPRLSRQLGLPILNLATAGDEVRYMLGVEERKQLIRQLTSGSPTGGPWDALLFSGGGNDIVDNPMALWVRKFDPAVPPERLVHQERFDVALALVRAGYEDLVGLRDDLSPRTQLFFHTYDHAIPDGRGVCHLGPWLKPTFELRGFPGDGAAAFRAVKEMLGQFARMLGGLQAEHQAVTVIDSQGTLAPVRQSWHNELHPSRDGFERFAALFAAALRRRFPGRTPEPS